MNLDALLHEQLMQALLGRGNHDASQAQRNLLEVDG
jgi:hypothetical protein